MTRREKELFAAAIRYASPLAMRGQACQKTMTAVAKQIAQYLTFEVTDDEITAAVAVNMAGKGERTTVRSKSQEKRLTAQAPRYFLTQDESCHWYVIRTDQEKEFEKWQDAMAECVEWVGHDFSLDAVGAAPGRVTFPSFEME